jgi:outer membrane immunogenic protein
MLNGFDSIVAGHVARIDEIPIRFPAPVALLQQSAVPSCCRIDRRRRLGQSMKIAHARLFCAGLMACTVAGSAFAADLTLPQPAPAPAPVAAPVVVPIYNWSGFFVGGHLGFGWSGEAITLTSPAPYVGTIPPAIAGDPHGIVAGAQYGTNWQFQRVVLGTESDISFTAIRRSQTITTTGATNIGEQKLPLFGTTRVRAGYAVLDNVLVYATGGLANGRTEANFVAVGPGVAPVGSRTKTLWGWALGGGVEYGLGPWSAKVEYLHYDLGTLTFFTFDPNVPGASIRASTKFAGDMVRAGVNYRFSWTPWQLIFGR